MDKRQLYIEQKQKRALEDGVVCVCKQVTERRIRKAVKNGARRFISVKQQTDAGSSCGLCTPFVEDIIEDEKKKR